MKNRPVLLGLLFLLALSVLALPKVVNDEFYDFIVAIDEVDKNIQNIYSQIVAIEKINEAFMEAGGATVDLEAILAKNPSLTPKRINELLERAKQFDLLKKFLEDNGFYEK